MGVRRFSEAAWFGRERALGYARVLAIAFAPSLVWYYLQAVGPVGSDFLAFWSAGRLAGSGEPASAYVPQAMQALQQTLGRQAWFPFLNPPPFLAVVAPLGALPYPVALVLWVVATYAAWLAVSRKLLPDGVWPIAVFPGALVTAWHAQNGFVTGALFAGAILSLNRRPLLAGALFGALVIKPQLALLIPVALAASGQWRAFVSAGLTACGLLAASWALFGGETLTAFLDTLTINAKLLGAPDADLLLRQPTVYAAAKLFVPQAAVFVQLVATLATAVIVWRVWRGPADTMAKGAVLAIATFLATPYAFHYDMPLLIVPVCWWAAEAQRTGWRPWEKYLLAGFYWSPLVMRAAALPLGVNLMPAVLAAWLALTVRRIAPATAKAPATAQIT